MATKTKILELWKPEKTGEVIEGLEQFNSNMDELDSAVAKAYRGKAVHNLLDNSDFRAGHFIAQAGLNGMHGTTIYLGDRWIGNSSIAATEQADGLILSAEKQGAYIYQKVKVQAGKQYTFAIHATGRTGMHRIAAYNSNNSVIYAQDYATDRDTLLVTFTAGEDVVSMLYYPGYSTSGGSSVLHWADLYPGAYTADTLPEYQPKGYAAELAECQEYCLRITNTQAYGVVSGTGCVISLPLPTTMRYAVIPTVTFDNPVLWAYTHAGHIPLTFIGATYSANSVKLHFTCVNTSPCCCVVPDIDCTISSDL